MRYRLIEEAVAENSRFIAVVRRNPAPDGDGVRLCFRAAVEPGIAPAVVDVRACLAARGAVHIENDLNPVLARPFDESVENAEAVGISTIEELPVKRDANRVETILF